MPFQLSLQPQGSDSASVIFDAMQSAQAKSCDVVLADTAGRLLLKDFMAELKIKTCHAKIF